MKIRGSVVKFTTFSALALLAASFLLFAGFHISRSTSRNSVSQRSAARTQNTASSSPSGADKSKWLHAYGKLPLSFIENQGQAAQEVRYVSHGSQYDLFLTPQEAVVALRHSQHLDFSPRHRAASLKALHAMMRKAANTTTTTALHMRFEGANPAPQVKGAERLPGKVNYFVGNDPQKWHTDIPTYAQVKYSQVYPGVDLLFYGHQRTLEYDFVVAPGADPNVIRMNLSGSRKLRLNTHGDILVGVADGEVQLHKPVVYQNIHGRRQEVAASYSLDGRHISFAIAPYDRREPLIIDPVLDYSTYLGGTNDDGAGFGIATDLSGDAFVVGQTLSADFPPTSALTPGADALGTGFVVELNPTGTALLYSTYLGGTGGGDFAFAVAVSGGDVYVTGQTFSTDFPTSGTVAPLKPTLTTNANGAGFLTKLDPTKSGTASLLYSSYLGGSNGDFGGAIAADAGGNAYVTGVTASAADVATPPTDPTLFWVTSSAFQSTLPSSAGSAFLTRIDTTQPGLSSLIYSTYLGGDGAFSSNTNLGAGDDGTGVVVDSAHKAYLCGTTGSSPAGPFPTTATTFQALPKAANIYFSAFISEIDTTLSGANSLVYSTYLGGSGSANNGAPPPAGFGDFGAAIDLQSGTTVVYVTGSTNSADFPIVNGFQTTGDPDAGSSFVTLLNTSPGTALKYSTYLSSGFTSAGTIKVDSGGNAYVAGITASTTFPATPGAYQGALAAGASADGFIAEINPAGTASDLVYFTYFGGSGSVNGSDQIHSLALGATPPTVYVSGQTLSTNLPATTGAFDTTFSSTSTAEGFAASLTLEPTLVVSPLSLSFTATAIGTPTAAQTVTLTNNTNAAIPFASATITNASPAGTDFAVSATTCGPTIPTAGCTISVTFDPSTTSESATLTIVDGDSTSPQSVALTGTAPALFNVSPTSLPFTASAVNTATAPQTLTITNGRAAAVTYTSATVTSTGGFAGDFTLPTNTCATTPTIAAGTTCTIGVVYTPSTAGAETATLTIVDTDVTSPQIVTLTGNTTPVTPGFTLAASPIAPSTVPKGSSGTSTITVTSVGTFNAAVTLACTGAPNRSTCVIAPSSVTPTAGGTATATLTFATTALVTPPPSAPVLPPGSIKVVAPIALVLMLIILLASEQRLRTRLAMAGALLVFVALSGCGGSGGTPQGTDTLTITGTSSGVTSQTATISVTVGPK